jgi:hypothetical protein
MNIKTKPDPHKLLRRYTSLPAVVALLQNQALTLTDPNNWEDKNDRFTIGLYKQRRKLQSVLGACFSGTQETFHHWKVFGGGAGGVCVVFKRLAFEKALKGQTGVRFELVKYQKLNGSDPLKNVAERDLPLLKRVGYKDELEYRVLWESKTEKLDLYDLKVPLNSIEKIVVNPWLPTNLAETVRSLLQNLVKSCDKDLLIKIERSYLVDSFTWKKAVEKRFKDSSKRQSSSSAGR